jgi:PIN domain nuclease of toxin-antitoxin system
VFKWTTPISYFEIAIKHKIGKLPEIGLSPMDFFDRIHQDGYQFLPLKTEHIVTYDRLTLFDDHRDPFDRLILATALFEGWPVRSADHKFSWYKDQIEVIW